MIRTCQEVKRLKVPRSFYPKNQGTPIHQQLFAFADASDLALCYVIYLRTLTTENKVFVSFVCGSTKVLPKGTSLKGQLSIPRAELCAADELAKQVLQVENEIDIDLHPTQFFTDSADVLAWINNTKDTAKRYITSRKDRICKLTDATQWRYIPTHLNPADIGTRPISVEDLEKSDWIKGPKFLYQDIPMVPEKPVTNLVPQVLFTAPSRSFFLTKTRYATEEITTGSRWSQLVANNKTNQTP